MKKNKIVCLIIALLTLVVSLIAFSATAAENTELRIVSKNISYDNNLKFIVAVPKAAVTDSVTFTVTADGVAYSVTKTASELQSDVIGDPTIAGIPCYAIMSDYGVALKDMAKSYTLTVTSGAKQSAHLTYSMAEYLYERLFKNEIALAQGGTPNADRKELYFSTLACGAAAERVLYNLNEDTTDDITTFADEYFYSNATGTAKLYKPGDRMTLTEYVSVYAYTEMDGVWSRAERVLAPGEITVDAHMIRTGKAPITDFEDGQISGDYFTELNTTYTTHTIVSGNNAPALSDGNVLKVTQGTKNGNHTPVLELAPMYSVEGGNIYVLDFDAYFKKPAVVNSTRHLLSIGFAGESVGVPLTEKETFTVNGYGSTNYKIRFKGTDDSYATGYTYNEWGSYRIVFEVTRVAYARVHVYSKAASGTNYEHLYSFALSSFNISDTDVNLVSFNSYNAGSADIVPYTYYLDNLSLIRTDDESYIPFEWDSTKNMNLVTEESGEWIDSFKTKFRQSTTVTLASATEVSGNSLVIGNVDCPISNKAYTLLNRYLSEYDYDDEAGYLIYVEGGSIAVAYNSTAARTTAINNLLLLAAKSDLLMLAGEIKSDIYSLVERAEESREIMHQAQFDDIERQLAGVGRTDAAVIRAELEEFFSYYDTNIIVWLANLYDKDEGGFYFSNSARDTIGYLPDVESTAMAFKLMDDGGLFDEFGGLLAHGIPEFMREPMKNWILGMQDEDTGYFYHPQWDKDVGSVRIGRDLENVVYLLNRLRVRNTYYSVPGHPEFNAVGAPVSAVALTSPLNRSAISAVSSIVAAASLSLPSYLQTPDAWQEYLVSLDINGAEKSYPAGNILCSMGSAVREADTQWEAKMGEKAVFSTMALQHLDDTQIPEIGLWEYNNGSRKNDMDPDDGIGYNGTNGLMKISVAYGAFSANRKVAGLSGWAMPNAYNALQSAIKVAKYGEDPRNNETVCYLLNNWTCISSTLGNIKSNDPTNYPAASELVLSSLADIIAASTTLLADHHLEGGGFKYYETSPCNAGNGTPLAYSPIPEADVNAVTVCTTSTINNIFSTLRTLVPSIKEFRLWCAEDYYIFMNELEGVDNVVKRVPDAERVTFDDYVYDEESTSTNVTNPSDLVYVGNINEKYHSSTVVTRPGSANADDKALRLHTFGITSTTKPGGPINAYATFANALAPVESECYLFESDICIDGVNQDDTPLQILFVNPLNGKWLTAFTVRVRTQSKVYEVLDGYGGNDGSYNSYRTSITAGKWFTLKLKLYKTYAQDGTLTVMTKVYINNTFVYETDCAAFGGASNTTDIGRVLIGGQRGCNNIIYLDNILCEKLDEAYTPGK